MTDREGEQEVVVEQLRLIVDLCQKDLALLQKLGRQIIPASEIHQSESRLICAQYLLAVAEDKPDEIAIDSNRCRRAHHSMCWRCPNWISVAS